MWALGPRATHGVLGVAWTVGGSCWAWGLAPLLCQKYWGSSNALLAWSSANQVFLELYQWHGCAKELSLNVIGGLWQDTNSLTLDNTRERTCGLKVKVNTAALSQQPAWIRVCVAIEELDSLRSQVMVSPPKNFLSDEFDDGELQTDGNRSGRFSNGEPDSVVDEDIFRLIGAQLAEIGDQVAREIQPRVVNDLVQQFVNENLSKEEIMRRLSNTVEGLVRTIPLEMEQEKAITSTITLLTWDNKVE
ncbi:unnamed protein product [Caretta caretta]